MKTFVTRYNCKTPIGKQKNILLYIKICITFVTTQKTGKNHERKN